jgi:hypothetical protein
MRVVTYQAMAALGSTLVGKLVTKELVLKLLQKSGAKLAAKSATKIVPLAGQIAPRRSGSRCFARWATSTWKPAPRWRRRSQTAGGAGRPGRAPARPGSSGVRQHHVDVEHFQVALAVQRDLDVVRVDLGVLRNHLDQFAVQGRQEVRAAAAAALARDDDLQPFLGRSRALLFLGKQE